MLQRAMILRISFIILLLWAVVPRCAEAARLTFGAAPGATSGLAAERQARDLAAGLAEALGDDVSVRLFDDQQQLGQWLNQFAMIDLAVMDRDFLERHAGEFLVLGPADGSSRLLVVARQGVPGDLPQRVARVLQRHGGVKIPAAARDRADAIVSAAAQQPSPAAELRAGPLVLGVVVGREGVFRSPTEAEKFAALLGERLGTSVRARLYDSEQGLADWFVRFRMIDLAVISEPGRHDPLVGDYRVLERLAAADGETGLLVARRDLPVANMSHPADSRIISTSSETPVSPPVEPPTAVAAPAPGMPAQPGVPVWPEPPALPGEPETAAPAPVVPELPPLPAAPVAGAEMAVPPAQPVVAAPPVMPQPAEFPAADASVVETAPAEPVAPSAEEPISVVTAAPALPTMASEPPPAVSLPATAVTAAPESPAGPVPADAIAPVTEPAVPPQPEPVVKVVEPLPAAVVEETMPEEPLQLPFARVESFQLPASIGPVGETMVTPLPAGQAVPPESAVLPHSAAPVAAPSPAPAVVVPEAAPAAAVAPPAPTAPALPVEPSPAAIEPAVVMVIPPPASAPPMVPSQPEPSATLAERALTAAVETEAESDEASALPFAPVPPRVVEESVPSAAEPPVAPSQPEPSATLAEPAPTAAAETETESDEASALPFVPVPPRVIEEFAPPAPGQPGKSELPVVAETAPVEPLTPEAVPVVTVTPADPVAIVPAAAPDEEPAPVLAGGDAVPDVIAQPDLPQELRPPGVPLPRPGRVPKAPPAEEPLLLAKLQEPLARTPKPAPLLPQPDAEPGVVYVAPFITLMVPSEVRERIFDQFVDTLNQRGAERKLKFVILKQGLDKVDRGWLGARKYVLGEIYGYVEDSGCCSTDLRTRARLTFYRAHQAEPALKFEYPVRTFFDHDRSTLTAERQRLADQIASVLVEELFKTLQP